MPSSVSCVGSMSIARRLTPGCVGDMRPTDSSSAAIRLRRAFRRQPARPACAATRTALPRARRGSSRASCARIAPTSRKWARSRRRRTMTVDPFAAECRATADHGGERKFEHQPATRAPRRNLAIGEQIEAARFHWSPGGRRGETNVRSFDTSQRKAESDRVFRTGAVLANRLQRRTSTDRARKLQRRNPACRRVVASSPPPREHAGSPPITSMAGRVRCGPRRAGSPYRFHRSRSTCARRCDDADTTHASRRPRPRSRCPPGSPDDVRVPNSDMRASRVPHRRQRRGCASLRARRRSPAFRLAAGWSQQSWPARHHMTTAHETSPRRARYDRAPSSARPSASTPSSN